MATELLVQYLNYSTGVFGLIGKTPQIKLLLTKKDPEGLSVKSTIMELLAFLIIMSYCAKQGYGIMSYLEIICAVVQTLVFLLVLLYYKNSLTMLTVAPLVGLLSLFYSFYLGLPHDKILDYCMAGVSIFLASSKFLQLKVIWETGNSENVSILRWLLASYMSLARVLTNLLGALDLALLANAALAFTLNMAIVLLAYSCRQPKKTIKAKATTITKTQTKGRQKKVN